MASELNIAGTMQNQMAGVLTLSSANLEPAGASWTRQPPAQIEGNTDAAFSASLAGGGTLSGTVVYLPANSHTPLTFTFSVDGSDNTATASYPMIGPTAVSYTHLTLPTKA